MDESTRRIHHHGSMRQALLSALLPTVVLFILAPSIANTQVSVVTDITSSGLGTEVPLQPPSDGVYNITGGTRPGGGPNLFHSFGNFSVGPGDIANFLNTPVNGSLPLTSNILGRVTGGNVSNIYGTIQTTDFGNANLFLVNPSGIVLGPQGSLNVGGSVSFSTAQYLRLFDGINSANFYADSANDGLANSVLAMAPVVDFGFLSPAAYGFLTAPDPTATITVQGSALSVSSGQSISLVGGNISIQGFTLPDGMVQPTQLSAPMGTIQIASTASPGEFDTMTFQSIPNGDGASFTSFDSVFLALGSSIGSGATTVFVKDGQLVLSVNDATLSTLDVSPTPPDAETIFLSQGSSIVTSNSGAESGADVQITVGNLNLDGAAITTENLGDGIGGNIMANVGTLSLANSASLNSNNFGFGIGLGGNVKIQGRTGADSVADKVMLSNGSTITTQTVSLERGEGSNVERGSGGDVVIVARDVQLDDVSSINTGTFGPGRGGNVHITADLLTLRNSSKLTTGTSFLGEVGGDLLLNVGSLRLIGGDFGGSMIESTNETGTVDPAVTGKGGNITIQGATQEANNAADSVVLSGSSGITSGALAGSGGGGRISIRATSLDLKEASFITSSTSAFGTDLDGDGELDDVAAGAGGDILVAVQNLRVLNGSTITSSTELGETLAVAGGKVTVEGLDVPGSKAGFVLVSGQTASIQSISTAGVPGDITVNAGTLTITNGAVINTGSGQSGPAGNVGITANSVVISAGGQIASRSAAQNSGQVIIAADGLTLDNGSIVTRTFSEQEGRGGDVVLNGGTVSLTNGASINSQSEIFSTGDAGNITMNNLESLTLSNHAEITSSSKGIRENAGDAGSVTMTSSGSFTSDASTIATSAENAKGGDILIDAQNVRLSNGTLISASSRSPLLPDGAGNAGNITINSDSNVVMQNSSVTTEASAASGGSIEIDASDAGMIQLVNSRVSTSVGGRVGEPGASDGGNINIDPQFVILQNSQILAQAVAGAGGAINIIATSAFIADPASIVSASSTLGISGTVNIQSPLQNVGGELTALSQEFSSAAALLAQQCAARAAGGTFSTFVIAAREGLPAEPGGFLASPSLTAELLGARLSGRDPQTQLPAVTGLFPQYDAKPIQLAKLGNACR